MTSLDFIIIAILLISLAVSLMRGFVREVLSLLAYVAAFILASLFGDNVAHVLAPYIASPHLRLLASYIGIFILVLLIVGIINMAIGVLLHATGLMVADRGLGGFFGLVRGIIIIFVLTVAASWTPLTSQGFWRHSVLMPIVISGLHHIKVYLPASIAAYVKE